MKPQQKKHGPLEKQKVGVLFTRSSPYDRRQDDLKTKQKKLKDKSNKKNSSLKKKKKERKGVGVLHSLNTSQT